jgi:hypothetical protein
MQRQYTADSRSPTIGRTPARNFPIRSTERQNAPSLPHLLDALRMQMQDDRKEQDELLKTLKKMTKNVQVIRKRQDDCWEQIKLALHREESSIEGDAVGSQESQTQIWEFGGGSDDFRAISEAEDSVVGHVYERDDETEEPHMLRQPSFRTLSATVGRTNTPRRDQPTTRPSTELHVDGVRSLIDQVESDKETDVTSQRDITRTGTASASRMPTPITPGNQQRRMFIPPPSAEAEMLDLTGEPSSITTSTRSPSQPRSPTFVRTSMGAPPPPVSKGKRKRAEKEWGPTQSANRLDRRAKTSAGKRNKELFEFANRSARQQSQALREESATPYVQCGDCRKPTCTRCEERRAQAEWSTAMRIQ